MMSHHILVATVVALLASAVNAYWEENTLPVEGHPGCSTKLLVSQGLIVDIVTSTDYGAKLVGGSRESSFSACITNCCQTEGCDLALYKTDGVSPSGRNCYYIGCGRPENCRMVENEGFMSATITTETEDEDGEC